MVPMATSWFAYSNVPVSVSLTTSILGPGTPDARPPCAPSSNNHSSDDLSAEDLRRRFQGPRVLGDLDARTLAERPRRHQAHPDAPRLAGDAGRRHGPCRA